MVRDQHWSEIDVLRPDAVLPNGKVMVQHYLSGTQGRIEFKVNAATGSSTQARNRIAREIKQLNDTVTALTTHIDRANLALLNDRLTQLRLRKECLEHELHAARHSKANPDVGALRTWARAQLAGLQDAMAGTRNDRTRGVIGAYVDRITVWPSQRRGELRLDPAAAPLWKRCDAELAEANCDTRSQPNREPAAHTLRKRHDRPEGRSRGNPIGATRFELATSASRTQRSSQAELRPVLLPVPYA